MFISLFLQFYQVSHDFIAVIGIDDLLCQQLLGPNLVKVLVSHAKKTIRLTVPCKSFDAAVALFIALQGIAFNLMSFLFLQYLFPFIPCDANSIPCFVLCVDGCFFIQAISQYFYLDFLSLSSISLDFLH